MGTKPPAPRRLERLVWCENSGRCFSRWGRLRRQREIGVLAAALSAIDPASPMQRDLASLDRASIVDGSERTRRGERQRCAPNGVPALGAVVVVLAQPCALRLPGRRDGHHFAALE